MSTATGGSFSFGEAPEIEFENVSVDLGSFFTQFVDPVLTEVKKITEPLDPVISFLTDPLDVVSDLRGEDTSVLDLLEEVAEPSMDTDHPSAR